MAIGTSAQQGSLVLNAGNILAGTLKVISTVGQNTTYTLPDPGAASATICISSGNCTASGAAGGDLTGSYPNPTIGASKVTTATIADANVTNSKLANSSLTVTAGTGLVGGGSTVLGGATTLSVQYGATAGTATQGSNTLTCASGTGNLSGGGNVVTLGSATSTCNNINISNSPTFSGNLSVTGAGGIAIGVAGTTSGTLILANNGNSNFTSIQGLAPAGQSQTITVPATNAGGGADTVCLQTLANCLGSGGITGSGTTDKLSKFTSSGVIADSSLSESGSVVTANGSLVIQGTNALTLGTAGPAGNTGAIVFRNAAGANTVTLQAPATDPASNLTFRLPATSGASGQCLTTDGSGTLSFASCLSGSGGGGGGVVSLNGLSGSLSVANATAVASTITLDDASTSQKGIAQFNATNFTAANGVINTAQNIATTSTPTFGTLAITSTATIQGALTLGIIGTSTGTLSLANATNANLSILQPTAPTGTGNATYSLPTIAGGTSDTICLLAAANCAGSGTTLQGAYNTSATGIITLDTTRNGILIRDASTPASGPLLAVQSNSGATSYLTVTPTATTTQNLVIAASASIALTGGAIGTRPGSPTEGMLYYDTTTKQLLIYANAKWQADRSTATKVVADASTSQNPESADFVVPAAGTSAQTTINAAIAALPASGGTVFLREGTYLIDGTIALSSNVTLTGSGAATVIKIKDTYNLGLDAITETGTATRMVISNLRLDGNKANNTAGTQRGIFFNGVGSTATAYGADITGVTVENFRSSGIDLASADYVTLSQVKSVSNTGAGLNTDASSDFNKIQNSTFKSNGATGITINGTFSTVSGNYIDSNTGAGIDMRLSDQTLTGNTISSNTGLGVNMACVRCAINNNVIKSNGGGGISTGGIAQDKSIITGNDIAINTGSGISLANGSDGFTVANNTITSNTSAGISEANASTNHVISGNSIVSNGTIGIKISWGGDNNIVSSNRLDDNGAAGSSSSILLEDLTGNGADNTHIVNNRITDTAGTGFGIDIGSAGNAGTYLADNTYSGTGATTIRDLGAGTIYNGQLNQDGNINLQGSSGTELGGFLNSGYGGIGQFGNLITYSEQLDNAAWTKTSVTVPTTNNAAPDLQTTGDELNSSAVNGTTAQTSATAAGSTYTFSVWLKSTAAGSGRNINLRIDGATTGAGTAKTVTVGSTWQRYSVTQNTTGFTGNVKVSIISAAATDDVYAWGAQLIGGSSPGAYVRSTATVITTSTGLVSNGGLFVSSINATDKPLIVQGAPSQSGDLFQVQDSTGALLATVSSTGLGTFNGGLSVTGTITLNNGVGAANTSINNGSGTGGVLIGNAAAGTISLQSGNSINITAGAASTWTTTSGLLTVEGANGSGSNVAGTALMVAGGQGTGSAVGGDLTFKTAKSGTGGGASNLNTLTTVLTLSGIDGSALFKNFTDSTTAFVVQNAAGTSNLFVADTTNNRIGIGTASPAEKLEVSGNEVFSQGANRTIYVAATTSNINGNSLSVIGGAAQQSGATSRNGGDLILTGGLAYNATGASTGGSVLITSGNSPGNGNSNSSGAITLSTPGPSNGLASGDITLTTGSVYNNPGNIILNTGLSGCCGRAGSIDLRQNGDSRIFVDPSLIQARVGINTNAPLAALHVSSGYADALFRVTDTTATATDVLNIANGGAVTLRNQTNSTTAFVIQDASGVSAITISTNNVATGGNAANATLLLGKDSGTSRSINAAGSINASGADYAEYIPWTGAKPAKGSVVSYKGSSYIVSSINTAAFIGNDVFDDATSILVTFSGQVPVRVTGAVTVGDILIDNGDGTVKAVSPAYATIGELLSKLAIAQETNADVSVKLVQASVGTTSNSVASALQNQSANFAGITVSGTADIAELNVSGATTLTTLNVTGSATFAAITVVGDAAIEGTLTVGSIVTGDITVGGHVITAGGQPTVLVQTAAGTDAIVSISGTDATGTITIITGSAPTAGELVKLAFSKTYGATPRIVLSPSNDPASDLRFFKGLTDVNGFIFNSKTIPAANTTYVFDYFIAQ